MDELAITNASTHLTERSKAQMHDRFLSIHTVYLDRVLAAAALPTVRRPIGRHACTMRTSMLEQCWLALLVALAAAV